MVETLLPGEHMPADNRFYREPHVRKSLQQMKAEYDQDRQLYGKVFHHYKTGDDYQLLFPTWDEETNEKQAVYVLCAMPWLKFSRPFEDFKSRFLDGSAMGAPKAEAA